MHGARWLSEIEMQRRVGELSIACTPQQLRHKGHPNLARCGGKTGRRITLMLQEILNIIF